MTRPNKPAAAAAQTEAQASETTVVTLSKPHTHAGEDFKAGDKIEVDAPTRQWLIDNEVISVSTDVAADTSAGEPV